MAIHGFSVAFDDPWDEPSPEWTRLDGESGLVASYSIRRGRVDALQKTGTGTAVVELNDVEGLFDPSNVLSPFFTSGIDGKQAGLALWNPVDDEWKTIFRGFIDGYLFEVEPSGVVTRVSVELVDGLDYLAGVELVPGNAGHPAETPTDSLGDVYYKPQDVNDRIGTILDNAGWPGVMATIFSGNVALKSTVYPPGTSALAAMEDAADAEFPGVANIYVSKLGEVTFHGRHARFDPADVIAGNPGAWDYHVWRAGDGSITGIDTSYAQIRRLSYARSRKAIINAAMALPDRNQMGDPELTPAEIAGQIVAHDTSVAKYGVRSWSAENLLTDYHLGEGGLSSTNNDLTETKKFADYYIDNFALPQSQITQLGFRSIHPDDVRGPPTWRLMCGVEVSDLIQLKTEHPGGGGFDESFYVEGINYDVRPLSPSYKGSDEEMHPGGFADVTLSLDVSAKYHYLDDPFGD